MSKIKFFKHQEEALKKTEHKNRVAFYHEMGLGKTFTGAEKLKRLNNRINLVIVQKSKITDWIEHFEAFYSEDYKVYNLRKKKQFEAFFEEAKNGTDNIIGVINYDLIWRKSEFLLLKNTTLLLDESSLIQNDKSKRTKFILKLNDNSSGVILLSGTPVGGKYENLISQLKLLGYNTTKGKYWDTFVNYKEVDFRKTGRPVKVVTGYKNIGLLKDILKTYGADFLKTEECIDLPDKNFITVKCENTPLYKKFHKDSIVKLKDDTELVGDCTLTQMLYERQLASMYNEHKIEALIDLINSTNDRLIVFYNFNKEAEIISDIVNKANRPLSIVNGAKRDLTNYENKRNSITLIQYQAGSMGLNLQKSNKIIYFSLPLSSEFFEQSKKRIHRIGQKSPCFYYILIGAKTIDEHILETLKKRQNYTEILFEKQRGL